MKVNFPFRPPNLFPEMALGFPAHKLPRNETFKRRTISFSNAFQIAFSRMHLLLSEVDCYKELRVDVSEAANTNIN